MDDDRKQPRGCAACRKNQNPPIWRGVPYWQMPGAGESGAGAIGMGPGGSGGNPGRNLGLGPGDDWRYPGMDYGMPGMPPYGAPWMGMPRPVPYYQAFGFPMEASDSQENERDMERLKEMYPDVAREILHYVEEACDRMEYSGSMMYDEQPDRTEVQRIVREIQEKMKDRFDIQEGDDSEEALAMNRETRRRYPPGSNWLGDMIQVILFQEMYRRRCKHRNCRRWY